MSAYEWDTKYKAYTKQCSCCKTLTIGTDDESRSREIFLETFSPSNGSADTADGLQSRCYICNSHRRRSLGVSLEWLRDLHMLQEGCCGICGTPISLDRNAQNPANVDHDATTGKVRQLLCGNCNRGLGLFFDNPEYLRMAADYLEFHKKEHEND